MRFILLIFTLCALNISVTLQAQDTSLQLDIRIQITGSDDEDLLPKIVNAVARNLNAAGIGLNKVEGEADEHVFISWYAPGFVSEGLHHFAIIPKQVLLETQPPILVYATQNLYERPLWLPLSDIDPKLAAELTSRAAVYSLGLCATGDTDYFTEMIPELAQQAENHSDNLVIATLYFYAGNCTVQTGDYDRAIDLLEQGVAYESTYDMTGINPASLGNLAWVHLLAGEPDTAREVMSTFVDEIATIDDSGHLYLDTLSISAQFYALAGDYTTAIDHLSRMIELSPVSSIYIQRGQMYRAIYEWDQSLTDFNSAIKISPDYAESYYQRGLLYYSILQTGTETRDEALADFQHYLELAPDGPFAVDAARYADSIQAEMEALSE